MDKQKKYGELTAFLGSLLFICFGLIGYNFYMAKIFKKEFYTYSIITGTNVFEKIWLKYLSVFEKWLGTYPSTKVIAVSLPVTLIIAVFFFDSLFKYIKEKNRNKNVNMVQSEPDIAFPADNQDINNDNAE